MRGALFEGADCSSQVLSADRPKRTDADCPRAWFGRACPVRHTCIECVGLSDSLMRRKVPRSYRGHGPTPRRACRRAHHERSLFAHKLVEGSPCPMTLRSSRPSIAAAYRSAYRSVRYQQRSCVTLLWILPRGWRAPRRRRSGGPYIPRRRGYPR